MAKKNNGKPSLDRWQVPVGGKGFALKDCDPGAKPYGNGDKNGDKARVAELASEIDALQDIFLADQRL